MRFMKGFYATIIVLSALILAQGTYANREWTELILRLNAVGTTYNSLKAKLLTSTCMSMTTEYEHSTFNRYQLMRDLGIINSCQFKPGSAAVELTWKENDGSQRRAELHIYYHNDKVQFDASHLASKPFKCSININTISCYWQ